MLSALWAFGMCCSIPYRTSFQLKSRRTARVYVNIERFAWEKVNMFIRYNERRGGGDKRGI